MSKNASGADAGGFFAAGRRMVETQNLASLRVSTTTTNDTIIAHACGNVLFMRTQVHTKKPVKPY